MLGLLICHNDPRDCTQDCEIITFRICLWLRDTNLSHSWSDPLDILCDGLGSILASFTTRM